MRSGLAPRHPVRSRGEATRSSWSPTDNDDDRLGSSCSDAASGAEGGPATPTRCRSALAARRSAASVAQTATASESCGCPRVRVSSPQAYMLWSSVTTTAWLVLSAMPLTLLGLSQHTSWMLRTGSSPVSPGLRAGFRAG